MKHDGKLHREFVEEGDNYVSRVEKTENGYLINGRTLEDLRQESMMESDEMCIRDRHDTGYDVCR